MKLHGEQIVIKQWDADAEQYVAIGASKSCDIQVTADAVETASPTSSSFKTYQINRKGWTINLDSLVLSANAVLRSGYTYSLAVMVTEDGSTTRELYGLAICQQADIQATRGQLAKGSFSFIGTGNLSSDDTPTPPSADNPDTQTTIEGDLIVGGESLTVNGNEMATQAWVLEQISGSSGIDMSQVWAALGNNTNEQINISHLSFLSSYATQTWVIESALAGYATESWVTTQLSGYATQTWVSQNYVSIAFFNRLFTALNGSTTVSPNDVTTTIDSIKAMVGFWTEQYISALGQGSGGSGGGVDMAAVWSALAAATSEQINISHLATALSGYALTSSIPTNNNQLTNGAGYITAAALSGYATESWVTGTALVGYATQTWVGQNYLGINANAATATKLQTPRTIWGQNFDGSGNVTGAMSDVDSIDSIAYFDKNNSRLGIGTSSPSHKLDVSGVIHSTTGIYSDGYVSALGQNTSSDERLKDIKDYNALPTIDEIADAPAIHYTWKKNEELGTQVGSIAQYWENVVPEAVHEDEEGYKSMQYDVIALASAITVAREVVDHERRIILLEKENEQLRKEIEQLRTA